jgi:diguanylate cyclase
MVWRGLTFPKCFSPRRCKKCISGWKMRSAAPTLDGQIAGKPLALESLTPADLLKRRDQRRQMLAIQTGCYTLSAIVLLAYSTSGAIPTIIPSTYFLCGLMLNGVFLVLSESHFNDRFEDHYLTPFHLTSAIVLQFAFLLVAPEIGYSFLSALFLIFGFGALRMKSRHIIVAWALTTIGLAAFFLLTDVPIGMPAGAFMERVATMLVFVIIIGQCAFVGHYGSSLRKKTYQTSVELKEAYKKIEELSELDDLTGAFNRRSIMRTLNDEIVRAQRGNIPLAIAMLDLDWFKRINDSFGHPTGDEVLRSFAINIYANTRSVDKLGRYGGEEFLLLLPATDHEAAVHNLDRLREIIAGVDWSAIAADMSVTMSAGVATLTADDTADSLLARANSFLYAAKERGRNRVAGA